MPNELLLLVSLLISFLGLIAFFRLAGRAGLYGWTVFVTISANIEVMILIRAFGMEQTLGNTLFAASFLTTDILSEIYGKRASNRAVVLGIATNFAFILLTLTWMLYTPSPQDWALPSIRAVFSNTPRMMLASLIAYAVSQAHDVWAYHTWWKLTTKWSGDFKKFLWVRNNCSTLASQLINTVLFTLLAFWGTYGFATLASIFWSSYLIFIITSLLDTPFVYLARWMYHTRMVRSGMHVAEVDQDETTNGNGN
ncbi:MAG: queuosine precursor transporter [Sphaerochaetaceae bacterium]|nr:queuosine precursor transporter [Spirochaetales bacterium]MDY5499026.1 queuosine precursor transporter [Sphaerochaetaceae bacterium]